ncbi:MAG: N-acyl homoserine lactonase family protein [Actinomycetia bacterium]|nr:N-acyl homoserine lactonase family protein [Actinomycetes bacterium]
MTPSPSYQVEWLAVGSTRVPEQILFHLGSSTTLHPVTAYVFLLTGPDGRVHLVDTGVRDPAEINAGRPPERHWHVAPAQTLAARLAARGIAPETVATVLLTHLHYDHCSQVALFPRATIVVSRPEWESVVAPAHPDLLRFTRYPRDVYGWMVTTGWSRLRLVADDEEVLPGIRAWIVGGHTPGSTAYVVPTRSGPLVLAGDMLNTYANWEHAHPPGLLVDLAGWFAGYERLRRFGAPVVPSHDPELARRAPGGLIA